MANILLIDDEALDRKLCTDALTHAGFDVVQAADGPTGLRIAAEEAPDLVLLDVLMPGMDGWMVCERLRQSSAVPLIMLTSLNREAEIARGLELGADDFVSKPISTRHLVARIQALLRRTDTTTSPGAGLHYDDGRLTIDEAAHRVTVGGRKVELTPTEFRLLVALAAAPGRTRAYGELLGTVWGPEYIDDIDFLRVYVWRLRKKLEADAPGEGWIENERGFGYRFNAPEAAPKPAPAATTQGTSDAPLVLLVEDDDLSARLMGDILEAKGIASTHMADGSAALQQARELQPALVVMDIGLPGLDGVEATRRLKVDPATRHIPVVAVTAYADAQNEARMRTAGCDAFLTKPLRLVEFAALVQGLLAWPAASGNEK